MVWRALLALSVLAGFFVLVVGIVVGLLGLATWLFLTFYGMNAIRIAIAATLIAAAMVAAIRTALAVRPRPRGAQLTRADQPELWRTIDELAVLIGTRAPDDLRLTSEVNAGVWEDPRLLRMRAGRRYLEIGLPLLAGLSAGELRAVLAHELGHYGHRHTRLAAMTYRAKVALELTIANMKPNVAQSILERYARFYAQVAAAVNRRQELEADAAAVAAAGRATAQSALRRLPSLKYAWDTYRASYLGLARVAGYTPPLASGFSSFLSDPARSAELAAREQEPTGAAVRSVLDSHPPIEVRVAAMDKLANPGVDTDDRAAWALIADPVATLPELERQLPVAGLGPRADWPTIVRLATAELSRRGAALLARTGRDSGWAPDGSIGAALDALERGELVALARPALKRALDPARVPAAATKVITRYLADAVAVALTETGRATHELNWGGAAPLVLADGTELDTEALVAPAVADRTKVASLRARLRELGVPLTHGARADESAGPVLATLTGVRLTGMRLADSEFTVLIACGGLLLAGADINWPGRPVEELRELPGTVWVASRSITRGQVRAQPIGWQVTITLESGRELILRNGPRTVEIESQGEAFTAMLDLIGVPHGQVGKSRGR